MMETPRSRENPGIEPTRKICPKSKDNLTETFRRIAEISGRKSMDAVREKLEQAIRSVLVDRDSRPEGPRFPQRKG